MNENDKKYSERLINISVLSKLTVMALIALIAAFTYSDSMLVLERAYKNDFTICVVVAFIMLETLLTLFWKRSWIVLIVHLCLYAFPGSILYVFGVFDLLDIGNGIGGLIVFVIAPIVWGIGLVPFIIYGYGRVVLKGKRPIGSYSKFKANGTKH